VRTNAPRYVPPNTRNVAKYQSALLIISFYRNSFNEATRETANLDLILNKGLEIGMSERYL
jgi:hypothetical protein